ncbi:MAG: copper-binding protein [SAR324 cluster bacterium]|nr:copper-binding protein [SAR324 cluster bacterium]
MKRTMVVTNALVAGVFFLYSPIAMSAGEHGMQNHMGHGSSSQPQVGHESSAQNHAHRPQENTIIQAEGLLNEVHIEKRKINITHQPIAALKWPMMRMDFGVKEGVSLQGLMPGQNIKFSLTKSGEYEYIITQVTRTH